MKVIIKIPMIIVLISMNFLMPTRNFQESIIKYIRDSNSSPKQYDLSTTPCISPVKMFKGEMENTLCHGIKNYEIMKTMPQLFQNTKSLNGPLHMQGYSSNNIKLFSPQFNNLWQCYQDGGPACYSSLNSIDMVSQDEGWAVGAGGSIYHYIDDIWQNILSPTPGRQLNSISSITSIDGWAVGYDFNLQKPLTLHWNGNTWSEINNLATDVLYSVTMLSTNDVWAVGGVHYDEILQKWLGTVLHWDGSTWQMIDNPAQGYLFSIHMLSSTNGWAVGHSGTQANYSIIIHWDGNAWTDVTSPTTNQLNSVSLVTASDGWAVGAAGTIIHWDGSTWKVVNNPIGVNLAYVSMNSTNDGWITGEYGTLLHWNGSMWDLVQSPVRQGWYGTLLSISFASQTSAISVGTGGTIIQWDGIQWHNISNPHVYWLRSISMVSASDGWTGGWNPEQYQTIFLHWNGSTWQPISSNVTADDIPDIAMLSGTDGWAIGWNNMTATSSIFRWNGALWHTINNPAQTAQLTSISIFSANDIWIVGYNGIALHWDGSAWQSRSDGIPNTFNLTTVSMISSNDVWAMGGNQYGGVIIHWNGNEWTVIYSSSPLVSCIDYILSSDMISSNNGWATTFNFLCWPPSFTTSDFIHWNGSAWKKVSNPINSLNTSVSMISSVDGWAVGDDNGYGYTRSTILHWDGYSWWEFSSPTAVGLSSVKMVSANEGWAVGGGAIIYFQGTVPQLNRVFSPIVFNGR